MENNGLSVEQASLIKDISEIISTHKNFEEKIVGLFPKANNIELCKTLEFVKSLAKEFEKNLHLSILKTKKGYDFSNTPLILNSYDLKYYDGLEIPKEYKYIVSEEDRKDENITIRKQVFVLEMLHLAYIKNINSIDDIIKKYTK